MSNQPLLDVITYGEAMVMFVATEFGELSEINHFAKRAAGAELNVAIGLARLGLEVAWLSRVGHDSFGKFILQQLAKENIHSELVTIDSRYPTGFQLKSKAVNGTDPAVEYFRKGSAASHLSLVDFNPDAFLNARHLHLSGVAAALSDSTYQLSLHFADFMRTAGKTVSFDPNLRPTLWKSEQEMVYHLNQLAFKADWVLPGIKEGYILTGLTSSEAIADFYLEQGVKAVIIKLGEQGAYFKDHQGNQGTAPACFIENVVDTVGAGDGFAVGVISALLEGKTLQQAVERGNRIGSLAIQAIGDSEGLPNRAQLGEI
ncbi:sugar kinase [Testudinibacter sp. TR-2022]|uniref:sugar kinase n=1 Tax=Testudinibacter sp. TR-2022 TaxID=2585029 RepID=UPI001119B08F|nr:sugar kinase [Testudinibacter sp. TR-2022]TNH05567.1 sugar kinase [Pasteurellaceae bacterium Phil11]TNH20418.1 sugar kinase [Testudinibacter sp. TR-2022]TNH24609.1 sugar kinase [Testudinibacter sp. TR-2022]